MDKEGLLDGYTAFEDEKLGQDSSSGLLLSGVDSADPIDEDGFDTTSKTGLLGSSHLDEEIDEIPDSDIVKTRRQFEKVLLLIALTLVFAVVAAILVPGRTVDPDAFDPNMCLVPFRVFDTHVKAFSTVAQESASTELNLIFRQFWRADVRGGVLVQSNENANDTRFLEKLRVADGNLRGVVAFPRPYDNALLDEFHRLGVRGVRFDIASMTDAEKDSFYANLRSNVYEDLFQFVRDRDWHLVVTEEGRGWERLLPGLTSTDCRIVVDHFGLPESETDPGLDTIFRTAKEYGLLWVKATPELGTLREQSVRRVVRRVIAELSHRRLIWGSAFDPDTEGDGDYDRDRRTFVNWFPDLELRFNILSRNPAELYAFDGTLSFFAP